jgi:hypothetical protein
MTSHLLLASITSSLTDFSAQHGSLIWCLAFTGAGWALGGGAWLLVRRRQRATAAGR